jgi:hypothetical protein
MVVNRLSGERHNGCDCQGQRQKQQSAEKTERSTTILRSNPSLIGRVFVVAPVTANKKRYVPSGWPN